MKPGLITWIILIIMADTFTIIIPCKKYTRVYLENNCGNPVDLRSLPQLNQLLINNLSKQVKRFEKSKVANYEDQISIIISSDLFYRYGWELTKYGILELNRQAEAQVKFIMRQYISMNRNLGIPVAVCIREFQDRYGFHEEIWPYESIKKDFDRHGKFVKMRFICNVKEEINNIFLENLIKLGTINKKFAEDLKDQSA